MVSSRKELSEYDFQQIIRKSFNNESGTLAVDGFLAGKVGRKVEQVVSTTSAANDTETFTFSEDGVTLFQLRIIYVDGTRVTMISAERTA